jgi:hypothetical protein
MHDPDSISYVEGFWGDGSDMIYCHAWNSWKGSYFDVTGELTQTWYQENKRPWKPHSYFKVIELSPKEAFHSSGRPGALQPQVFILRNKLPTKALDVGWNVVDNQEYIGNLERLTPFRPS